MKRKMRRACFDHPRNEEVPLVFRYMIEFDPLANPPGRTSRFESDLRVYAASTGLDCVMGALGGNVRTYGWVGRPDSDVSTMDRMAFLDWIVRQPIKATVSLGEMENEGDCTSQLMGETDGPTNQIDNLSETDRTDAARSAAHLRDLIAKAKNGDAAR